MCVMLNGNKKKKKPNSRRKFEASENGEAPACELVGKKLFFPPVDFHANQRFRVNRWWKKSCNCEISTQGKA